MKTITTLTDEQIARMPEWVDKWTANGWSTEPADWDAAERGIREIYRLLDIPLRVVSRSPSPLVTCLAGLISSEILRASNVGLNVRSNVRSNVWNDVGISVGINVENNVRDNVRHSVGINVWNNVGINVMNNVWDNVGSNVENNVWDNVESSVWNNVGVNVGINVENNVENNVRDNVRHSVGINVWNNVGSNVMNNVWNNVGSNVGDNVRDNVESSVMDSVESNVESNVMDSVESNVMDNVWGNVRDNVRHGVWGNVWNNVWNNVGSNVMKSVEGNWFRYVGGNLWSGWFSYISFLRDVCGYAPPDIYRHDELVGISSGWYWPANGFCIVTDRPCRLVHDGDHVLHCEDGMAAQWRDGWGFWMLRGVRVDEQIVMRPETQTVEQIRGEKNEEVKRLRIERYGWPRYLNEIGATRIDSRRNDIDGTREYLYRGDDMVTLLCVCPSTTKVFALEVPPDVETCEQAQNYLSSGLSGRVISAS